MPEVPFPSGLPTRPIKSQQTVSGGEISQLTAPTRAIGEAGAGLANFGQNLNKILFNEMAAEKTLNFQESTHKSYDDFLTGLQDNHDVDTWGPGFVKFHKGVKSQLSSIKSPVVRANLAQWLGTKSAQWQGDMTRMTAAKINSNMNNSLALARIRSVEQGDITPWNEAAATALEGNIDPQQLELMTAQVNKEIDAANDGREEIAALDVIFGQLSAIRDPKTGRFDPKEAMRQVTIMEGLTEPQRNGLEARITSLKDIQDQETEEQKIEIDTASVAPQSEFLANYSDIIAGIDGSVLLTVKDKEEQRKKVNARFNDLKAGKVDPINTWDADAYTNLAIKIRRSPYSVKISDIRGKVGLGEKGGITADQSDVLTELWRTYTGADVVEKGRHAVYSSAINGMRTAKAFSLDKTENSIMAAEAMTLLDAWAIKQEDPTDVDYQNFFDRLTSTADLSWWDRFWVGNDKYEGRLAVGRNLAKLQQEVSGKPLTERPAKYPDAVWNSEHNTWTVIRDGRLKGIE